MLRYTNMFLIRAFAALIIFSFSFNKCLNAKTILATYDISWNNILLGNIFWEFSVLPQSYNFSIKLESSGLSSKLYPFYGIYSSSGIKTAEGFFSPEKYNHVWRGKKKEKLVNIVFSNNKIKEIDCVEITLISFPNTLEHTGTTHTDVPFRYVLNVNYI